MLKPWIVCVYYSALKPGNRLKSMLIVFNFSSIKPQRTWTYQGITLFLSNKHTLVYRMLLRYQVLGLLTFFPNISLHRHRERIGRAHTPCISGTAALRLMGCLQTTEYLSLQKIVGSSPSVNYLTASVCNIKELHKVWVAKFIKFFVCAHTGILKYFVSKRSVKRNFVQLAIPLPNEQSVSWTLRHTVPKFFSLNILILVWKRSLKG